MQEETVQPREPAPDKSAESAPEKSLEQQLAEARATIEQQKDTLLRAVADAENARKRAQAEAAAARKFALESFAETLLPVVDGLEAAVQTRDPSGVELVLKQLVAALEKSSVRAIDPQPGERFDPYRHQAMAAVEAPDARPNTIVSLMQKGYALHDRVIRPALVTVAKAAEDKKAVENNGENPISGKDPN